MKAKELLKYRNVCLGFAMIWIVWYHSKLVSPIGALNAVKDIGYGGADICLFASGIGCYFSLTKDADPYSFMKRRFARLLPVYFCFMAVWAVCKAVADPVSMRTILGNVLGVQNFTTLGNAFNWYISAIFLFYILAPLFKSIVEKTDGICRHIFIILLLVLFSVPFWTSNVLIITMARIPIFYIGMLFAKSCINGTTVTGRITLLYAGCSILGIALLVLFQTLFHNYMWSHGLYWYPFILITPGLCIAISLLMHLLDRNKCGRIVVLCLDKIGQYSFEIYLVHILVFNIVKSLDWLPDTAYIQFAAIVCSFIGSIILHYTALGLQKCAVLLLKNPLQ